MANDPFDPRFPRFGGPRSFLEFGKIDRPGQATFQVRGCGDPSCSQCNPETADLMRSTPSVADAIRRAMTGGGSPFTSGIFASSPAQPPSDDYEDAREKVEKWIVEMKGDEQTFDDIQGNEAALGQLRDAIRAPVEHKELYEAYGMRMPKGALLSGPPGCGKTMFARAAAAEMRRLYASDDFDAELISISGAELQSPYVGVTEGHIKDIFNYARLYKEESGHPLLVFIDEAEVLFPDRTGRVRKVAPWEESQVATFLAEMDGLQESGAFVLLASNRPEVIDQAVLRDGRCDFKIKVNRPDRDAVAAILARAFKGAFVAPELDEAMLVFAALESLLAPDRVIYDFHAIVSSMEEWFKAKGLTVESPHLAKLKHRAFLLEHIVSGAMAVSIPGRAKRYAFARDKAAGVATGITVEDVLAAVGDVFEENKALDHSYAMVEFQQSIIAEVEADLAKYKGH